MARRSHPLFTLLLASTLLTACTTPATRSDDLAARHGFERAVVRGTSFDHVTYRKEATGESKDVHVYLGSDGTPYQRRGLPAADPTPRNPLTLRLMAQDPNRAVFLGRPCYQGLATEEPCTPDLWTTARYGDRVVASLAVALEAAVPSPARITLIGYSGGGTLAMLLAARSPRVDRVITVAANLDVAGWTAARGLAPLRGSLDPGAEPPLPARIRQLHLVGGRDGVVPVEVTRAGALRQPGAEVRVFPEHDHVCCWEDTWNAHLAELRGPDS